MMRSKISIGSATVRTMCSTFWMAIVFGVSSPSTMWPPVMMANASASEIVCPMASSRPAIRVTGRISVATNGSPTQPRPREASVMPSCVTESDVSRWSVSFLAYAARLFPASISVSRREGRIFTTENSAATKKPFMKMRKRTRKS